MDAVINVEAENTARPVSVQTRNLHPVRIIHFATGTRFTHTTTLPIVVDVVTIVEAENTARPVYAPQCTQSRIVKLYVSAKTQTPLVILSLPEHNIYEPNVVQ